MILFSVLEALHRAFTLHHEEGMVRPWMAVQLVVYPRLVAVERDMATLGLRGANIIPARRPAPDGLLFRIDDRDFSNCFHCVPPGSCVCAHYPKLLGEFTGEAPTGASVWNRPQLRHKPSQAPDLADQARPF